MVLFSSFRFKFNKKILIIENNMDIIEDYAIVKNILLNIEFFLKVQ